MYELAALLVFSVVVFVFYTITTRLALRRDNPIPLNSVLDELDLSRKALKTKSGKLEVLKAVATVLTIFGTMLVLVSVGISRGIPVMKFIVLPVSIIAVYHMLGFAIKEPGSKKFHRAALAVLAAALTLLSPNWIVLNTVALVAAMYVLIVYRNIKLVHIWAIVVAIMAYDAVAVFGSGLMEGMAIHALDTPLLLTAPQNAVELAKPELSNIAFALGLGDIVIPGLIIMLAANTARKHNALMVKINTIMGYVVGLFITFWFAKTFESTQPATIYLVPATLGVYLLSRFLAKRTRHRTATA